MLCGVVVGIDAVEGGVHNGFNGIESVKDLLRFVECCAGTVEICGFDAEFNPRYFDKGVDVCILRFGLIDLFAERFEEFKGFWEVGLAIGIYQTICELASL